MLPPTTHRYVDANELDAYAQERCEIDVYLPARTTGEAGAEPAPLLVWFHGGGMVGGDKRCDVLGARCTAQGIVLASANYRLSPRASFPAYLHDGARAVRWAVDHAVSFGADPGAIFVGGISAGAWLAAMLLMDDTYLHQAGVSRLGLAGGILLSGQTLTHLQVRSEYGLPARALWADGASVLYHRRADTPPLLLMVGDDDLPMRLEENQLLLAALREVGHPDVALQVIAERNHGTIDTQFMEPGDPAGLAALRFIRRLHGRSA